MIVGEVEINDNLTINREVFLLLVNGSKLIINAEDDKAHINVVVGNILNIYQQKASTSHKVGE